MIDQKRPGARADSAPAPDDDELPPCIGEAYRDTLQSIWQAAIEQQENDDDQAN